ncbi:MULTISPECIES: glycerol-3-phosphate 1-O-acyltransferase [Gordonia]|uniref:Glycerol-3-phosphate O-acyltransferase n=2 Tax=Gordonia TaxID=2053 RepID=L7LM23_9ACTN|nr:MULTISPECIES: glycerol-3-phosphate 1-O-acyltransferase [Gordonia]AUH69413.1 glycerol-3-phosphate acyltransferase [Gordonia sp. YC-JH1]KJR06827.1 glycerol-3-phosphate acyltransferase [Gordonia sihwensis]WFN94261.1 glycerol-3-phosphate 1-O-acyltransferase [Gordonia sihwensis]GAC61147.1 glycerol-3-phosphate O-acyltransferase [Gordonia sihwensis NBRC 108236]
MSAIVLAQVRTGVEQEILDEWAAKHHPGVGVVRLEDVDVAALDPDTTLIPARVVWLPPVRRGERKVALADAIVLSNPRRPPAFRQAAIRRHGPDRVRVVQGVPATVAELGARYDERQAEGTSFAGFVGMQAAISAERAELELVGTRYKVPRLVAEQISSSARFQAAAAELAAELGRSAASVAQEATDKMSAFVATQSRLVRDVFTSTFSGLYERAWSVSADLDTLGRLRSVNKSSSLVFLPSHRSYVDSLILASVLHQHDFPPNLVLGGENLAFWPMGPIARRAGTVFIRRKFGADPVYKLAMRSYLSFIVEKRFNLEWYIEGGRSRTGKLRPPMLGLLAYVADAVEALDAADVVVVPTSIVYDQLPEIAAMAKESAGGTKSPEDLKWLLKYARAQRTYRGEARVRFGEPFSLREALAEAGTGRARLEKVAFKVMDEINAATPISATSLAGFALLGAADRAYTAREIEVILAPLLTYIDTRGLPGPDPSLCRGLGLLTTLRELTDAGVLETFDGGPEQVWSIAPDNHAVAAYYRNGALHHFVGRAIVELGMLAVSAGDVVEGGPAPDAQAGADEGLLAPAQQEVLRIRDLLKFEFFFPAKQEFLHRLGAEMDLLAPGWRTDRRTKEWVHAALLASAGQLFARRTLQTFFDAQLVVATRLVALGSEELDKEEVLTECLGLGRQLSLQGVVHSKDSVSRELYDGAYRLADNRGAVHGDSASEVASRRRAWLDEVEEMRCRLARIAEIEAAQAAAREADA